MAEIPDWVTLTQGEEVVWTGRPSLVPYVMSLTGEIVMIAIGFGVWLAGGIVPVVETIIDIPFALPAIAFSNIIAIVLILFGGIGVVRTIANWLSIRFLVTTEEIYQKTGLFSRTVTNIRLSEIQNTQFTQSWLGRILSYGTVSIATAGTGGTDMSFRYVTDPDTVVERITQQLDRA